MHTLFSSSLVLGSDGSTAGFDFLRWDAGARASAMGSAYTAADGDVLRVNTGAEGAKVTITAGDAGVDKYVSFTSRGAPKLRNGSSQSGVYRVCDDRGLKNAAGGVVARGVLLNASGRVRVTKDATRIGACP